jgi:hypothetical protein
MAQTLIEWNAQIQRINVQRMVDLQMIPNTEYYWAASQDEQWDLTCKLYGMN